MTAKNAWNHFPKSQCTDFTHLDKNGVFVWILKPEFMSLNLKSEGNFILGSNSQ